MRRHRIRTGSKNAIVTIAGNAVTDVHIPQIGDLVHIPGQRNEAPLDVDIGSRLDLEPV